MKKPTTYIRAAGEQYHAQRAIKHFGVDAVVAERAKQLSKGYPGVSPILYQMQALAEVGFSQEIEGGGTPYRDVHKALQAERGAVDLGVALRKLGRKAQDVLRNESGGPSLVS